MTTSSGVLRPTDIDERFVPVRRNGPVERPVGDGLAIYQPLTGGVHLLNATAALVWSLCDGDVDAGSLIDDLTGATGLDRAMIAADVVATLRELGEHSLLEGVVSAYEPAVPPTPGRIGVDYPQLTCSPCVERIDAMGWTAPLAIEVGTSRVGLRADRPESRALLERLLRAHVVDDERVLPNYGVRLVDDPTSGRRDLHQLWQGHVLVASSRRGADVVAQLVADLSALAPQRGDGPDSLLELSLCGVLHDGAVTLVPDLWRDRLVAQHRRAGTRPVGPPVLLDPVSGEMVVAPPRLDLDESALHEIADRFGEASSGAPAPVGRYPVTELVLVGGTFDHAGVLAHTVQRVTNRLRCEPDAVLGGIVDLVGAMAPRWRGVDPVDGAEDAAIRALGR